MDVHIQSREGAEELGSAVLLAALDDLMVTEYSLEPGTEPGDPHYHADHSDSFYVLEGELEFQIDGRTVRATAGTLVAGPARSRARLPGRDRLAGEVPEPPHPWRLRGLPARTQPDALER
jgi:mannose-6-phosphate isomerase-like protein (cupin superfamily)